MNSVGIDISKGRGTIAVMRPFGEVVISPFEVCHTDSELSELARQLKSLNGETRVVMEATGNYHAPVAKLLHDAGLYVSVVNAKLVHGYANQIPYQRMTPISQTQYKTSFTDMQNNFVRYWSVPVQKPSAKPQLTVEQQEQIRRVFHSAVSAAAHFSKPSAPIASLVFDGLAS